MWASRRLGLSKIRLLLAGKSSALRSPLTLLDLTTTARVPGARNHLRAGGIQSQLEPRVIKLDNHARATILSAMAPIG